MENIWENLRGGLSPRKSEIKSLMVAKKISDTLRLKNINKGTFATIMGTQPSVITRWLSGKHNFTIETLFDIEEKLQIKLLDIDVPDDNILNFEITINSNQTFFNQNEIFPGFTSIVYEKQLEDSDELSEDLDAYLKQLQTDLENKKGYNER